MADPKTSQASISDTLSLDTIEAQFGTPNFQPQYLPNFGGYPFSTCAGQKTSIRSITLLFPLYPLPFRGCGPPKSVKNDRFANCKIRPQWPRRK